jgi:hypothetical protein
VRRSTAGLTEDGAAQALGWPKARVSARVKVLQLPERAQQLIGEGVTALSAVDRLRAIAAVAPALLDAVIAYLNDGNESAAERFTREPGWVLDAALTHSGDSKVFAAYPHMASARAISEPRRGAARRPSSSTARRRSCTASSTATPTAPRRSASATKDVDPARAAGVLIEFEHGRVIIVDDGGSNGVCRRNL